MAHARRVNVHGAHWMMPQRREYAGTAALSVARDLHDSVSMDEQH